MPEEAELIGGPLDGATITKPPPAIRYCDECHQPVETAKSIGMLSKTGEWTGFIHHHCAKTHFAKQGFKY